MIQGQSSWHSRTAQLFTQLYACVWQQLEPFLGSATTLELIGLSTRTLQEAYPFLTALVWRPTGLESESLLAAFSGVEQAHIRAGCERLLQDIQLLVLNCCGTLLAQQLQAAIEQIRCAYAPASDLSIPDAEAPVPVLVALPPEAALPLLQSMGQQSLALYRRLQEQQAALDQAQAKIGTLRRTTIPASVTTTTPTSTPDDTARAETFYHDLFDLSPDGVIVTNTNDDILQANLQCAAILEFDTPGELIGRNFTEFLLRPEQRDTLRDRISLGRRVGGILHEMRTRRGHTIIVMASSRLIDYEGRSCLLSVLRDVTERARLRQEMEDFAYSASHDLQAPLRTFEGYARWLLEDYGEVLDVTGRQLCQEIIDDALHMKKLLDSLLEYSRIGRQHTQAVAVEVTQVLDRVLHDLQLEIVETNASIEIPESLPTVVYPEIRLTQIFTNLLSNALKFTAARTPEIVIGCEEQPTSYRFTVRDNGIGIAPEHYGRIFEIFKRLHTREEYPGTGAGLTIVKKIVESYGGQIGVESVPGIGSTFWFTVPKMEETP
jgi:PAS domain S-box-containing protein